MDANTAETAADSSLSSSFEEPFVDGHYEDLSILDGLLHYTGNIVNKQFEGEGVLRSPREVYKGGFKNNKYCGRGEWVSIVQDHPSGVVSYTGDWEDGLYHGHGTVVWSNGDTYTGPFVRGAPHGSGGTYTYKDGRVYVGDYFEGLRHGHGRLTQPGTGDFYDGTFDRDAMTGEGKASYQQGTRLFQGTWKDGRKVHGTMRFPGSNRFYTGAWQNDLPNDDKGAMEFANGDRYEGGFRDGQLYGIGHLVYAAPRGKWYYGHFLKDHPHGKGFLFLPRDASTADDDTSPGSLVEGYFDAGALIASTDTNTLARVQGETAELPALDALPPALRRVAEPDAAATAPSRSSSSASLESGPPAAAAPGATSPTTQLTSAAASCKGWLEKFSIGRKKMAMAANWKRRFFVLAPFNDIVCLGYYEDELCGKPVGLLRLNPNTTRIVSFPSPRTHKKATKPGRELCVVYEDKGKEYKLLLRAASAVEHRRWLGAMRQCFHTFDLETDAPLDPSTFPAQHP